MHVLDLQGIRRGKRWKTTTADPAANRPADLVKRRFNPAWPNALWVADFTYVASWVGVVYVAFVIDAYARRILGLARRDEHAHPTSSRRARPGGLGSPPRRRQPRRAGPSHRRGQPRWIQLVVATP